jgi:hypothetical protein
MCPHPSGHRRLARRGDCFLVLHLHVKPGDAAAPPCSQPQPPNEQPQPPNRIEWALPAGGHGAREEARIGSGGGSGVRSGWRIGAAAGWGRGGGRPGRVPGPLQSTRPSRAAGPGWAAQGPALHAQAQEHLCRGARPRWEGPAGLYPAPS